MRTGLPLWSHGVLLAAALTSWAVWRGLAAWDPYSLFQGARHVFPYSPFGCSWRRPDATGVRGGGRAERLEARPYGGGSERKGTGEGKAVMSIPGH
jgi:hypothetical protein